LSNTAASTFWAQLRPLDKPHPPSQPKFEYDPAAAEIEAQAIIALARSQARAITESAQQYTDKLRRETDEQSIELLASATEQGKTDGFEAAKREVEAEMSAAWDRRVKSLQDDVQLIIDSICEQRRSLWEQTEQEVLAFVLEMAKRVVKIEIQQNKKVLAEIIRHSLRRISDKENIRIRVNPDDVEGVRADRKDLLLVLDGARALDIIDDRRIGPGGCVIETAAGTIDARIETQFEQIADKLGIETTRVLP
jgi:flagellar assembly protein FliH